MTRNTGGPAFPTENERQTGANSFHYEGMTLRDYFAAKAMLGLIAQSQGSAFGADPKLGAEYAYRMADAMLAERAKQ